MVLEKTLPILIIFCLGLLLKRIGIVKREHAPMLNRIIFKVVLPATVMNAVSSMTLSNTMLFFPLAGLAIVIALLGSGFLLAPLLGLQGTTRGAFLMAFPSLELGSIGYACMFCMYGGAGVTTMTLLDLGNAFFFFTIVAFLAATFGQTTRFRLGAALLKFVQNPVLWAYGIGLALNTFHLQNILLTTLFTMVSQALVLLIMLLLAVEVEFPCASWKVPALSMYLKMSVGIIIGVTIVLFFGLSGMARTTVVLGASLPSSFLTVIYAREHGLDTQFLATQLSLALPVAIGMSALLLILCH